MKRSVVGPSCIVVGTLCLMPGLATAPMSCSGRMANLSDFLIYVGPNILTMFGLVALPFGFVFHFWRGGKKRR